MSRLSVVRLFGQARLESKLTKCGYPIALRQPCRPDGPSLASKFLFTLFTRTRVAALRYGPLCKSEIDPAFSCAAGSFGGHCCAEREETMAGDSMRWRKAFLTLICVLTASCAPETTDVPDDDVETRSSAVVLPSLKVEAEAMTLSGYTIATHATASGGRIVRTTSTGRATTTFSGAAGTYDIVVTYIDAPGGSARFTLTVNGVT